MKSSYPLLLLTTLMLAACGDEPDSKASGGREAIKKPGDTEQGTPGASYARYSGLAGNRQIALNMVRYPGHISASYYTLSDKRPVLLTHYDTAAGSSRLFFKEGRAGNILWQFQLQDGGKLAGSITGGVLHGPLSLNEAYPEGSYPMVAYFHKGAGRLLEHFAYPQATAEYGMLWPSDHPVWKESKAAFVASGISVAMKFEGGAGVANGLKTRATRYFSGYRNDLRSLVDSNWTEERRRDVAYNYSTVFYHDVLFNDDNWVVLKSLTGTYTGGAHGMYSSTFLNLDLETRRDWRLIDVVKDTSALKPYLALAARDYFGIGSDEDLSSRLLAADVPPTANYYLTPGGLTFVYNPYDIASYADGEVPLFIPFSKLMNLLTEQFKVRMNFSAGSGTAQREIPVKNKITAYPGTNKL